MKKRITTALVLAAAIITVQIAVLARIGDPAVRIGDVLWNFAQRLERSEAPPAKTAPAEAPFRELEEEVLRLTNLEREQHGLEPLVHNEQTARVARLKSNDLIEQDYFAHESPTYGSPFEMMGEFGIRFTAAAENLAMGQRTPEEAVRDWMDSPGHRANILSEKVTEIGVGVARKENGTLYWTQMFLRP